MYTIETAAAAVGRNKNAILRAIKAGKILVAKDENGELQIDPAALCLHYGQEVFEGLKAYRGKKLEF